MVCKRQNLGRVLSVVLAVSAISIYPVLFLFSQNAAEVTSHELLKALSAYLLSGIIIWFIAWVLESDLYAGGILATVIFFCFANFAFLERMIYTIAPVMRYWHCAAIILVILLHVGIVLKRLDKKYIRIALLVLGGVFVVLDTFNAIVALPTVIEKGTAAREIVERKEDSSTYVEAREHNPNFYYIIADEYSGFESIKRVYGYDNEAFASELEGLGFTVSRNSYNDDIRTVTVTANLAQLDYVVDYKNCNDVQLDVLRKNGRLFSLFAGNGYRLCGVGGESEALWGLSRIDGGVTSITATDFDGKTFGRILLDSTVIYPFLTNTSAISKKQAEVIDAYRFLVDGSEIPKEGAFVLSHFDIPHTPFVFDANGRGVYSDDWEDSKYYLGQFEYCTDMLKTIVKSIIDRDPGAIIVLQSDHGARASAKELQDKKNILNAVYYRGEAMPEIEQQSGVNTLRLVMNRLFDCRYEILDVPNVGE